MYISYQTRSSCIIIISFLYCFYHIFSASAFAITSTKKRITSKLSPLKPTLLVPSSTMFNSQNNNDESVIPELPDPNMMRVKEIKNELNQFNISYDDCFDKESLVQRLVDARNNPQGNLSKEEEMVDDKVSNYSKKSNFDKQSKLEELNALKVKELRTLCAKSNIRWAHMIEKSELITALIQHYESMSEFSPSGTIRPGQVSVITNGDVLHDEIYTKSETPLLLDVFATWCGPCKLMSPQLDDAANELGDSIRIAKIDSDAFPEWSNKLNVKGLPTLIVFDGKNPGKELQRVEGALMKDDLVRLAKSHI